MLIHIFFLLYHPPCIVRRCVRFVKLFSVATFVLLCRSRGTLTQYGITIDCMGIMIAGIHCLLHGCYINSPLSLIFLCFQNCSFFVPFTCVDLILKLLLQPSSPASWQCIRKVKIALAAKKGHECMESRMK